MTSAEGLVIGSKVRRIIQNPYRILNELSVSRSQTFLDIGCGTGFLSIPASAVVGPEGTVYAVDVSENYINQLTQTLRKHNIQNIKVFNTSAEKLDGIPDESVDRAVFLFSLHHVEDIRAALETTRKKLKKTALLYVYDPVKTRFFGHGTTPSKVLKIFSQTGYKLLKYRAGLFFWKAIVQPI
ncbi:MAG: class I SAM-dependent methyltransferase [Candidatus Caldarchaeum sp.]|nr:class I SAM-dependent methyltransferase [Candidatus Caldarchaeum sp.]